MIIEAAVTSLTVTPLAVLVAVHYAMRRRAIEAPVAVSHSPPSLPIPKSEMPALDLFGEPERRAEVRRRMAPRLIVSQARAAEILVEFMNAHNLTGYYTASEIDQHWEWCMAERDIERMNGALVREALAGRNLKTGKVRINAPEFAHVRQRNPRVIRPVLYRIPKVRAQSGEGSDGPDMARMDQDLDRTCRKPSELGSGIGPGTVQAKNHGRAAA